MFHVYISIIILFHLSPISGVTHYAEQPREHSLRTKTLAMAMPTRILYVHPSTSTPKTKFLLYIFDVVAIPFINWTFKTIKKSVYLQFVPLS